MPGGIFPHPPSITSLLSLLPPPISFRGPFVNIDELISIFTNCDTIALSENKANCLLPNDARSYFSMALDSSEPFNMNGGSSSVGSGSGALKRSLFDEDDDGDGDNSNLMPPQFDIYRTRQLNKKPKI